MTIKVMLADDNREFTMMIADFIAKQPDMEVIAVAHHGEDVLRQLEALPQPPDVLLLDIIMPHLDGLGVLERLHTTQAYPKLKIVMITAFGQDYVLKQSMDYGVGYYMLKPLDLNALLSRIRELAGIVTETKNRRKAVIQQQDSNQLHTSIPPQPLTLDGQISMLLAELSVPLNVRGYHYLRMAIELVYDDMSIMGSITKLLYPKIADKFLTTPSRVERAIRHGIELAWTRSGPSNFKRVLNHAGVFSTRPTNSQFIATLADRLRLEHGKRSKD